MKKLFIVLLAAALTIGAAADEGMWLLPLLEKMNIKTMQKMGCRLSADEIYSINKTSLKDAVVIFGNGCTGEVVSDKGLLLTNHHCGYGAIQTLSSVEHDYLADGYWAMSFGEELPVEGLTVTFLQSFTDVTDKINKATKDCKDDAEFRKAFDEMSGKLTAPLEAADKYLKASVVSFFGGNAYYLIGYRVYNDIRFVGAPPSSIGKFGADTDNWMWPRHTCDFSVFRIYSDKDGNPAEYSEENVPYVPKKKLNVSLKGVKDGDFSMIMGYPGRTNRFMTSSEVAQQRDVNNAIGIYCRGERQKILLEDMLADPAVKIKYASKYSGSTNAWKKWMGMNEAFEKLGVEERRAQEEAAFTEWVNAKKSRQNKYGTALDDINQAVAGRAEALKLSTYLRETLANIEIAQIASSVVSLGPVAEDAGLNARIERFYKNYSEPTDRKVTARMIEIFREGVGEENLPDFYQTIDNDFGGDVKAFVDDLFDKSAFSSAEKLAAAMAEEGAEETLAKDPAAKLFDSVMNSYMIFSSATKGFSKQLENGHKAYIGGQMEMNKGKAMYPDANFTMRLTYGTVKSYSPKDGVLYDYYTTLKGVMEKEDPDNWEFVVPERLKLLYKNKAYGRYARPDGTMPACFIMTGDITGGNSGSPVLDADGNMIGLAFDGNWESMSGDIIFEPDLQRCICVDIRYVLFIIEKFGGCSRLVDEMNIIS
ncbi:MAG: S46 family peptidase [Bacteroidales bacterium]|nr:S46 family peptidase [Bacteroidales bacterium]